MNCRNPVVFQMYRLIILFSRYLDSRQILKETLYQIISDTSSYQPSIEETNSPQEIHQINETCIIPHDGRLLLRLQNTPGKKYFST